jgi:hypothetical protein
MHVTFGINNNYLHLGPGLLQLCWTILLSRGVGNVRPRRPLGTEQIELSNSDRDAWLIQSNPLAEEVTNFNSLANQSLSCDLRSFHSDQKNIVHSILLALASTFPQPSVGNSANCSLKLQSNLQI